MRSAGLALLILACGLPVRTATDPMGSAAVGLAASRSGPKPPAVTGPGVANQLTPPAPAADTLVSTVRWTNPGEDGKGPLDSLKVNINNFAAGGGFTQKFLWPFPSEAVFRQPLPFRDAIWVVTAQVCVYRGSSAQAAQCVTAESVPFEYGLAAPRPVTGAAVTNVKVP